MAIAHEQRPFIHAFGEHVLLGNAIGVAIPAALYVAGQTVDPAQIQSWGIAIGSQENVALRFGGAIGLLFNVFMVVVAIAPIGN